MWVQRKKLLAATSKIYKVFKARNLTKEEKTSSSRANVFFLWIEHPAQGLVQVFICYSGWLVYNFQLYLGIMIC